MEQKLVSLFWFPLEIPLHLLFAVALSLLPCFMMSYLPSNTNGCITFLHCPWLNYLGINTVFASLTMVGFFVSWSPQSFHLTSNNGNLISSWDGRGGVSLSLYGGLVKTVNHGAKNWALDTSQGNQPKSPTWLWMWRTVIWGQGGVWSSALQREDCSLTLLKVESAWILDIPSFQSLLSQGVPPSHQFFEAPSDFPEISWMDICKCIWENVTNECHIRLNVKSLFMG